MSEQDIITLKQKLKDRHQGDAQQLDVIFTNAKRILVEAPAGYGKTNTMISKIAYMICTQQIPTPKRLLALTFSVNAAYKIKRDISAHIPFLLEGTSFNIHIGEKIYVSNYHGFSRSVLKKYGKVYHTSLANIDKLQSIDDSNLQRLTQQAPHIPLALAEILSSYSDSIKNIDELFLESKLIQYNDIVIKYLLPHGLIPYNAILTLTIQLFDDYPKALTFYQRYFRAILVDEFQDTNIISYWLLTKLITSDTKIILLGDSLQRIYGFIGAVPNLLKIAVEQFNLEKITLDKNYRFASNPQMLLLDYNIRRNAEDPYSPTIINNSNIDLFITDTQENESHYIINKSKELLTNNEKAKLAILTKQRGPNLDKIIESFDNENISYFNALFSDDDQNYIEFHKKCLFEFIDLIRITDSITRKLSNAHLERIQDIYKDKDLAIVKSLSLLLKVFWHKIISDYRSTSNEDKIILIKDTFEHNGLKQYIEYIDSKIIISTVHAAKGLEWDFVILPDMEQNMFPGWMGLCSRCTCRSSCKLTLPKVNEYQFLEELSVFYVAVTRARKQIFFTSSTQQERRNNSSVRVNISCFLSLPGIVY